MTLKSGSALLRASTAILMPFCVPLGAQIAIAQDQGETVELAPISVQGSSYETEGSGSYTSDLVSVGEKSAIDRRRVPQSTSVITRRQIEDGGYTALETALNDTPGLLILDNDIGRSSIYSRGYEFDYLYFDGLPAPVASIYGTQPDLAIVDHVEVLKGPAGLFIGTGEPAGSINMRLKQATAVDPTGYVTTTADSFGHGRVEADVAGALNASGTLRGRAVLAYADGDGFVDKETNGVKLGYGTLAWDISPDTKATFAYSHMERDIAPFNGLPTHADGSLIWIDPSATTEADWNDFDNAVTDYVAAVEHRLAGGGRLKFSLRQSHQQADFLYAYAASAANADNQVSGLSWLARDFQQDSLALDAHAELPFTLGRLEGTAVIGADWQHVTSTTLTGRGTIAGTFDLDDWDVSGVARPTVAWNAGRTTSDVTSRGVYAQVRVKPVAPLTVIGGARVSWYDGETGNLDTGTSSTVKVDGHVTPFAGLTYDVTPRATVYASYSEIFIPQSAYDVNGDLLDPVKGEQAELGVKAEIGQGLNVSAALFDLREVNRPLQVTGESYYVADEEVRSRGVELELSGEVTPNLHLAGGYTYTDTDYTSGPNDGSVFSSVTPQHMFKLQADYRFTRGVLQGVSLGGRLRAVSSFSSRGIEAPGYGVVDVTAGKTFGNGMEARIAVNNLFDKDYYTRVGSTALFNFRGAPRSVTVSLTKRF